MAEVAVLAAPSTHSQPSRKGKKAWRKNVDLTEIQSGLNTVREEIRRGGVIAEKPSDELFVLDAAGDEKVLARQQSSRKKLLRADEILAKRSAVPGLDGRKRKQAQVEVTTSNKRPRDGKYVSHREMQRLKRFADDPNGVPFEDDHAGHDPWAAPTPQIHDHLEHVPKAEPVREPKTLRQYPPALTVTGKREPALRKPEAGKSYNPTVDDWSNLLQREGAAAVEAEQARISAEAIAAEKQIRAEEEAARVEAAEKEELLTDYESDWDGFHSENEVESFTAKMKRRKTPAERNKIKARKAREALEKMQRNQKERDKQEQKLKQIVQEMAIKPDANVSQSIVVAEEASDLDDPTEAALQRRRFGKLAVPDAPLEVVLPEELQDSLRRLKPEGNLMTDRYRNILINGKMEVRKRRGQAKKGWTKSTEKWSYKDWTLK